MAECMSVYSSFVSLGRKRKAGIEQTAKKPAIINQVALKYPFWIKGRANRSEMIDPAYPTINPQAETLP
jgi:hypothetical protein